MVDLWYGIVDLLEMLGLAGWRLTRRVGVVWYGHLTRKHQWWHV